MSVTPHGDKLQALRDNRKLPDSDRPRLQGAIDQYNIWIDKLDKVAIDPVAPKQQSIKPLIDLLNQYRLFLDVDVIFDSPNDFLYRQKGQLKLDNTVIEEFLPILVRKVFAEALKDLNILVGPTNCFSSLRFESSLLVPAVGGGLAVQTKDQDFAMSRQLYVQASYQPDFNSRTSVDTKIAYITAECKTNLDKTMFQEGAATALNVKQVVPGAEYYLLCEWLDMTPISTATTAIDEILILQKDNTHHIQSNLGEIAFLALFPDAIGNPTQ